MWSLLINVSAIDVGQIVGTIRAFLDRITFVIQFIGLFSIITGLIVLAGSAATSEMPKEYVNLFF